MACKYDSGVELLLAHMNIEDIISAAERLYQLEEEEEEALSLLEEGLSQEEMDENEEAGDSEGSGGEQKDYVEGAGGVRYGTVSDLLSFVNLLSSMQPAALQHLPEEMGVLLNKVRSDGKQWLIFCVCSKTIFIWGVLFVFSASVAEVHAGKKRPLSDQHGRAAVPMETDL